MKKKSWISRKKLAAISLIYLLLFASSFIFIILKNIPTFSIGFAKVEKHNTFDIVTLKSHDITNQMLKDNPKEILFENQVVLYPGSGYITEIIPVLTGTSAKNILHHGVLTHIFHGRDLTCPNYHKLLFASGEEMTPFYAPEGYGYPIKPLSGTFALVTHFTNDPGVDLTKIHFEFKIKVSKEKLKPIEPIRLDINNDCNYESAFIVPANTTKTFKNRRGLIMPFTGRLLLIGAHVHKYSKGLELYQNTTKILEIDPITDSKNEIISIIPRYPQNIILKNGDNLDIKSAYSNTEDKPVEGMGIFFAYLEKE